MLVARLENHVQKAKAKQIHAKNLSRRVKYATSSKKSLWMKLNAQEKVIADGLRTVLQTTTSGKYDAKIRLMCVKLALLHRVPYSRMRGVIESVLAGFNFTASSLPAESTIVSFIKEGIVMIRVAIGQLALEIGDAGQKFGAMVDATSKSGTTYQNVIVSATDGSTSIPLGTVPLPDHKSKTQAEYFVFALGELDEALGAYDADNVSDGVGDPAPKSVTSTLMTLLEVLLTDHANDAKGLAKELQAVKDNAVAAASPDDRLRAVMKIAWIGCAAHKIAIGAKWTQAAFVQEASAAAAAAVGTLLAPAHVTIGGNKQQRKEIDDAPGKRRAGAHDLVGLVYHWLYCGRSLKSELSLSVTSVLQQIAAYNAKPGVVQFTLGTMPPVSTTRETSYAFAALWVWQARALLLGIIDAMPSKNAMILQIETLLKCDGTMTRLRALALLGEILYWPLTKASKKDSPSFVTVRARFAAARAAMVKIGASHVSIVGDLNDAVTRIEALVLVPDFAIGNDAGDSMVRSLIDFTDMSAEEQEAAKALVSQLLLVGVQKTLAALEKHKDDDEFNNTMDATTDKVESMAGSIGQMLRFCGIMLSGERINAALQIRSASVQQRLEALYAAGVPAAVAAAARSIDLGAGGAKRKAVALQIAQNDADTIAEAERKRLKREHKFGPNGGLLGQPYPTSAQAQALKTKAHWKKLHDMMRADGLVKMLGEYETGWDDTLATMSANVGGKLAELILSGKVVPSPNYVELVPKPPKAPKAPNVVQSKRGKKSRASPPKVIKMTARTAAKAERNKKLAALAASMKKKAAVAKQAAVVAQDDRAPKKKRTHAPDARER
jgi:hypothetical protein